MASSFGFPVFVLHDGSQCCDHLTDYLNFWYGVCCTTKKYYVRSDRFLSSRLELPPRARERAHKDGLLYTAKSLTKVIKTEIRRVRALYEDAILGNKTFVRFA